MTVLVTGATGLLGSHVVAQLLERGERVRMLVQPGDTAPRPSDPTVEVRWGDMTDAAALAAAVRGVDRVIHCAARKGPWGPQADYQRINVQGLGNLVHAALDAGVSSFVHVSSLTVHGNDVRGSADEHTPFFSEPNPYSRSKIAGELLLSALIEAQQAPITIVRPGWIYGAHDVASFARYAERVERGRMVVIGSGHNPVPLIYVSDVALGIVLASRSAAARGRSYILVNDEPVTQWDFLSAIARELGVPPPRLHLPYHPALWLAGAVETAGHLLRRREQPPIVRYGIQLLGGENRISIARARQELGFVPQVTLAEGVRRGVAWYRSLRPANAFDASVQRAAAPALVEPEP